MEVCRRIIIILLALAVVTPVILKNRRSSSNSASAVFSLSSAKNSVVSVAGDVRHPGIYPITATTMTNTVINMAEPLRVVKMWLPKGVELLKPANGSALQVVLRRDGTALITTGAMPAEQRMILGVPLDINQMNRVDFERIPGIGPVLAKRIMEYRQSIGGKMSPKDLLLVDGIGDKKYGWLNKYF